MKKFLLAFGEYGLGYRAVYGVAPIAAVDFELYSYIQRRCVLCASQEGRDQLRSERAIAWAIEHEGYLADFPDAPAEAPNAEDAQPSPPVLDPDRMSDEEIAAYLLCYAQ